MVVVHTIKYIHSVFYTALYCKLVEGHGYRPVKMLITNSHEIVEMHIKRIHYLRAKAPSIYLRLRCAILHCACACLRQRRPTRGARASETLAGRIIEPKSSYFCRS